MAAALERLEVVNNIRVARRKTTSGVARGQQGNETRTSLSCCSLRSALSQPQQQLQQELIPFPSEENGAVTAVPLVRLAMSRRGSELSDQHTSESK